MPPQGTPARPTTPAGSRWTIVAPVAVALLAAVFTVNRIEDFDTWFHLAAGRLMTQTWTWPASNTFSLTAPDYPWIDLHWIFQLLLYGAWVLGGLTGATLFAAILVASMALLLYYVTRRFVPPMLAAFLVAVALTIASPRYVPRPELMSFVYFVLYLVILEGYPRNGRLVFLLVPLQILWTNTQGIFAVGLALMGCYWLGATLAFLPVPRGWRQTSGLAFAEWRRLTIVVIVAALACLVNPWGIDGALFPFQLLPRVTGNSLFSMRIGEFRAPLQSGYAPPMIYAWLSLLVASGLSFLLNLGRWHLGRLLAVAAFGFLSTQSLRNVAFFSWMAVPVIAANVGPLLERRTIPARVRGGLAFATLAAIVVLIGAVVTNRFSRALSIEREFGFGVSRARFPEEAVAFLERAGIKGRAFNCLAMGGFLTWSRPEDPVFVDGRLEAFPESVFRNYFQVMDEPGTWPNNAAPYKLDYALLYHGWSNRLRLVNYLAADHGWTMVYYDEIASIFIPNDDAHRAMREHALTMFADVRAERARRGDPLPPSALARAFSVPVADIARERSYGEMLRSIGLPDEAAGAYRRALVLDPNQLDVKLSLGFAYWEAGQRDAAIREWREILARDPTDAHVRQILSRATGGG